MMTDAEHPPDCTNIHVTEARSSQAPADDAVRVPSSDSDCTDIHITEAKSSQAPADDTVREPSGDNDCSEIRVTEARSSQAPADDAVRIPSGDSDRSIAHPEMNMQKVNAHFDTHIDGRSTSDVTALWLIDAAFTTISDVVILLLVDHNNRSLKCCRVEQGEHGLSSTRIPGNPCKLALTEPGTVVLSAPRQSCLCFMEIFLPCVSYHKASVTTLKPYWGLTALNSKTMLASTTDIYPVSIDIINITGNILKSFSSDVGLQSLFCRPDYLKVLPSGDILMSDWGQSAVLCFTKDRQFKFRFERNLKCQVRCPVGIDYDQMNIYVTDRDANTVVIISPSGDFIQTLLTNEDGLISPLSLCIHGNKLCVTLEGGDVKLFSISDKN